MLERKSIIITAARVTIPYPSAETSVSIYCGGQITIMIPTAIRIIEVMMDDRLSFPSS